MNRARVFVGWNQAQQIHHLVVAAHHRHRASDVDCSAGIALAFADFKLVGPALLDLPTMLAVDGARFREEWTMFPPAGKLQLVNQ